MSRTSKRPSKKRRPAGKTVARWEEGGMALISNYVSRQPHLLAILQRIDEIGLCTQHEEMAEVGEIIANLKREGLIPQKGGQP